MKFDKIQNEIFIKSRMKSTNIKVILIKPKVNVTNSKTKKIPLKIAIKENITKTKMKLTKPG